MKVESFESVWDALEPDPVERASLKVRSEMMIKIDSTVSAWRLSQKDAAARLGITQPRLNDLLKGRIDKFSLDALVDLATKAGLSVTVKIKKKAA